MSQKAANSLVIAREWVRRYKYNRVSLMKSARARCTRTLDKPGKENTKGREKCRDVGRYYNIGFYFTRHATQIKIEYAMTKTRPLWAECLCQVNDYGIIKSDVNTLSVRNITSLRTSVYYERRPHVMEWIIKMSSGNNYIERALFI